MITETTITEFEREPPRNRDGVHLLVMSSDVFVSQPLPVSGVVTIGRSSKCNVRIEDPLASREHARLHLQAVDGAGFSVSIEDLASANGTRVRDELVKPGELIPIVVGEAVLVGTTVLMVLRDRPIDGPARRIWSHVYFEHRVEDECMRAAVAGQTFALARLRFDNEASWLKVLPVLARDLPARHIFAAYGPKDYEILFIDVTAGEPDQAMEALFNTFKSAGLAGRWAVAWYPKHGRSADALLAHAHALLRPPSENSSKGDAASAEIAAMDRVRDMAARAASSSINVLILGETGVGKEVLASVVHQLSPRAKKPFVALNCAGLTESLIASELFGHEKGAFTGAVVSRTGLLESANGGTVFLDEIGELPLELQAKLLRVIETREVTPVGAVRPRPIDVRFVAATNRDLESLAANGEFRRDLYFRLNGISLLIPPLRERADEIAELVRTFISRASGNEGRERRPVVSAEAMKHLMSYSWPGNIRELRNVIERALVLCDGEEIRPEHLPLEKMGAAAHDIFVPRRAVHTVAEVLRSADHDLPPLTDPAKQAERQRILDALVTCMSNQTRAAYLLGMPRRTFVAKLDYYGIPRPQKTHRQVSQRNGHQDSDAGVPSQDTESPRTGSDLSPIDVRERQRIVDALATCGGNQTRAAMRLGISRGTLLSRIERFQLARPMRGQSSAS